MDLDTRELLAFPAGDNSSDTLINGIHYNLTTLRHWNYTYYSNGTFSNGSLCFLLFEPYIPHLLQNGTFLNSTSCYSPILPLKTRSEIGLLFACFFALSIMFTFINLRKHGRLFLPTEKRFRAVGRRWQWYWMLVVAALAMISGITNVDIDRYYLPELPIVLSNFFWFLMLPSTICIVWESVRHWGSWQERQIIDPDPFLLRKDDHRSKVEFYLPLLFYFFVWMNFFMVIPRSWGAIELQRDPDQARLHAEPSATDLRFKAAAFLLFGAWLTTVFSLQHSIKHYKPRHRRTSNQVISLIRYTPIKFMFTLPTSLALVGYEAVCSFDFSISPLNINADLGMMYGLGWGTIAVIIVVHEVAGYINPNEDKELIRQRRLRGIEIDREMGIAKKPYWWSKLHGYNGPTSLRDRIRRNVSEIGGGQATTRNLERSIEMKNMPVSKKHESPRPVEEVDTVRVAAHLLFSAHTMEETQERFADHAEPDKRSRTSEHAPVQSDETKRAHFHDRSDSNDCMSTSNTLASQPQQFRSMLDV